MFLSSIAQEAAPAAPWEHQQSFASSCKTPSSVNGTSKCETGFEKAAVQIHDEYPLVCFLNSNQSVYRFLFKYSRRLVALLGSVILLGWRWGYLKIPPTDMIKKIPWHILIFAFSMYVLIYGLHNIGMTHLLVTVVKPIVEDDPLHASLLMGGLMSFLSTFFNNHPALMVGTLTLTQMDLEPLTLKIAYLSSVIGSDIGSLFLPIGTLASLIWLHILKQNHVKVSWDDYVKVTAIVIPPTVIFTLAVLAVWVQWLYG